MGVCVKAEMRCIYENSMPDMYASLQSDARTEGNVQGEKE